MINLQNTDFALAAIERISDGVFSLNLEGKITYINRAASHLFEIDREDSLGKQLEELFSKETQKTIKNKLKQALEQQSNVSFELEYSEQPLIWLEFDVYPSIDGVTVVVRDITSSKQVELALKEKQEKLILLSEAANHIIFKKEPKELLDALFNDLADYLDLDVYFNYIYDDSRGKLRLMNYSGIPEKTAKEIEWLEFGEAVCGCVARDQQRMIAEHINVSDDERVQLVKGFGIKAYACHPLMSYGKMIGTLSFGSSKRTSFSDEELDLIFTICNQVANILERTFLMAELTKKKEEAEKANVAKSEFISMMSHELRTPLNSIIGFAQILEHDTKDPLSTGQRDKIQKVLKSGRHLLGLINDILTIVKLEARNGSLKLESISINNVVAESIKTIEPLAAEKGIEISYRTDTDTFIKADFMSLTQVMLNLLSNAVKYTRHSGKITVTHRQEKEYLQIEVQDTGIGIPIEEQDKIFAPFYRIFNQEMNIEGAGLGLAISKNLIQELGGNIGVSSISGKGSRFWFSVPIYGRRELGNASY